MLQSTDQKRLSNKEGSNGPHGSPWKGKIDKFCGWTWGRSGWEQEGAGGGLERQRKRILGETTGIEGHLGSHVEA